MKVLSIDPGNLDSAYTLIDQQYKPINFSKVPNDELLDMLKKIYPDDAPHLVIEKIASYGMAVGKEVFDTCIWSGRFWEAFKGTEKHYIYRKDVKLNLYGSMRAKDTNIRQALVDRFAQHDLKNGKGTKGKPDWFCGFKSDIWAAYAVGVTYLDKL